MKRTTDEAAAAVMAVAGMTAAAVEAAPAGAMAVVSLLRHRRFRCL